ncbi:helix-turn-helix domain-containing protein [Alysiella filiformis]|uniref:Helix-turn-helix domain-containing protein n=1 Tax=Alysiella filiformis DSM 16848 TaxID=1120981 RepID=A0A286EAH7_9NEIS|nr:helix-turn-helix transcriptional regulator [Alysiella filiformis]QMT32287.1 helix-turn-helix transcriptional regulator [Alysiella filiformis]UBQ56794.1 helix-turn-helix domain-containing protein [Alysiella filiformis DSM 16848]SOD67945.1 Helix-turn-helix domain-containing protein [Alysiella filiformis DSM 16848]
MTVAKTIKMLREVKNWSQEEMAEKLSISKSSYARWESGENQLKLHQLEKVAEVFQIDVLDLLKLSKQNAFFGIVMGDIGDNSTGHKQINCDNEYLQNEIEKLQMQVEYLSEKLKDKETIIAMQQEEIKRLKQNQ